MNDFIPVAIAAIIGFLIGGFPTGVLVSRRRFGIDVREIGSGNIGATNVTRAFGWWAGLIVFAVDFLKGYVPLLLARRFLGSPDSVIASLGVGLVFGHCYSPYLMFRGGKGVATSLGCVSAVIPLAAGVAALCYVILLAISKVSAVGSLGGVVALLSYLVIAPPVLEWRILVITLCGIVTLRHKNNISRLIDTIRSKQGVQNHVKK